jgi:hypothetical protein
MMTEENQNVIDSGQSELTQLVQRGMAGDRSVLPALRQLLDTRTELWREVHTLAERVEQTWLQVLSGEDLVTQEILSRQLQEMKMALNGPYATPLERLLVERITIGWLQMQQAELMAVRQVQQHGSLLESWVQQRQDRVQARLLVAVKALAQVRKLLRPQMAVQVNIAQQQVNVG